MFLLTFQVQGFYGTVSEIEFDNSHKEKLTLDTLMFSDIFLFFSFIID
jgi:hypothetical protein